METEFKFKIGDRVQVLPSYLQDSMLDESILFIGAKGQVEENDDAPFILLDIPITDQTGFIWKSRSFSQYDLKSI